MSEVGEVSVLARAHALFAGTPGGVGSLTGSGPAVPVSGRPGGTFWAAYRSAAETARLDLGAARAVDGAMVRILARAGDDHRAARIDTAAVLAAARADGAAVDNPIAAREMLRRRIRRLRAQQGHVLTARRRARRNRAALLALRYRRHRPGDPLRAGGDPRAGLAVRAALSRLGAPYVWGAAGPHRFDCSGLVKWAYAQAGVPIRRTTYEQIGDGMPVPRSQVRPGDLVFPHTGHVQMAIGRGLVVEAPHAGAVVRISPLGHSVSIRRPV